MKIINEKLKMKRAKMIPKLQMTTGRSGIKRRIFPPKCLRRKRKLSDSSNLTAKTTSTASAAPCRDLCGGGGA